MKKIRYISIFVAALCVISWPLISLAHVHVEKSIPADGASLSQSPQKIDVWFTGKVNAEWSKIEVTNSDGKRVDLDNPTNDKDDKHLSIGLKPLDSGEYSVKLNVISGDGHRVKGSISFAIHKK